MKAKRMIELVSLSTTLYALSKETKLMEKLGGIAQDGKNRLNAFVKQKVKNDEGEELEFTDKIQQKFNETKSEFDKKMSDAVQSFYQKVNVVHKAELDKLHKEIDGMRAQMINLEAHVSTPEKKKK